MRLIPHPGHSPAAPRVQWRCILSACAAALAMLPPLPAAASQSAPATVPAAAPRHSYAPHVAEAARRFGIPDDWILRVMHVESRGNPRAVSRAGAMGLMQIMPATWTMLSARHGLGSDPFDVRANILAGAAYLRAMWDRYGSVSLMLAAYNAGPGRADAHVAGRRRLPAETRAYVARLAPTLGSSIDAPAPIARNDPPSWRDARLFTRQPDPAPEVMDERAKPASPAPLDPLFVRLSGRTMSRDFRLADLDGGDRPAVPAERDGCLDSLETNAIRAAGGPSRRCRSALLSRAGTSGPTRPEAVVPDARLQGCDAPHRANKSDTHLTHACIQLFRHFSRVQSEYRAPALRKCPQFSAFFASARRARAGAHR